MSNYFTLKNRSILNPPTGTDLGSGNNKYANVYVGNQLTVGTTTVDSTSIGSIKIAGIVYPGDDTAADTAGGQTITVTGSGFVAGASVIIDGTTVSVVTVVSSTQITFTAPAKTAGSYSLYVINPDGATAISVVGIQFSGVPAWNTAAGSLSTIYEGSTINTQLSATGDAPVIYSLVTGSLPGGLTLSGNGRILGTANTVANSTTYNFTIKASDYQNQDTNRSFSYTVNPDAVTFNTPASNQTYSNSTSDAFSLTVNATSAAGQSISYTANTLPTGLTLSGANISGTLSSAGSTTSLITATAAGSAKTATRTLSWTVSSPTVTVSYLLVGGGGGGNTNNNSGGGGGGGVLTGSTMSVTRGTLYAVTVGGGGGAGSNGTNSVFNSLSAGGGGYGGVTVGTGDGTGGQANSGTISGCAGGEGLYTRGASPSARTAQSYGSYKQGGSSVYSASYGSAGGGGGGYSANGGDASIVSSSYASAGNGGAGYNASAWGLGTVSGGGGASGGSTGGNAGSGGGSTNYGGGGNSIVYPKSGSEYGGPGIVIIQYADTNPAATATTGSPTITVAGGYRVYKWTSSGSITF